MKSLLSLALVLAASASLLAADRPAPLKVLLITGGCCHDYAQQKDILKNGLEKRANVKITQVQTDDKTTKPPLAILGNPDYAKGYDLVIHDECAADVNDPETIKGVLKPHREDGIPGMNLHCAMHCYRVGDYKSPAKAGSTESAWFDYLGLQSSGHGQQAPIDIAFQSNNTGISTGFKDWTTIKEELYNNVQIFPSAQAIAKGKQMTPVKNGQPQENEFVVAWTNMYQGKTRVFSTTIGHNNETVSDDRYLNLLTRGLLWACGKLNADGTPMPGYGPQ